MPAFVQYLNIAAYALGAIAVVCWFVAQQVTSHAETITKVIGYTTGGLCLLCSGITWALPDILSPRETIVGEVERFHQVASMDYSYFEFTIQDRGRSHVLHSDYFDKGFYFGDPLIYDGVTVAATYLTWTGDVVTVAAKSGKHAGWSFRKNTFPLGVPVLILAGIVLMIGGIRSIIEGPAKPKERGTVNRRQSGSILGL